ncbi:hypothetical protein HMI54_015328 [Coelomomyces lativittatus]|nr:hypothetical protein HMI54_015328 [Coelomomyces lativittatus]
MIYFLSLSFLGLLGFFYCSVYFICFYLRRYKGIQIDHIGFFTLNRIRFNVNGPDFLLQHGQERPFSEPTAIQLSLEINSVSLSLKKPFLTSTLPITPSIHHLSCVLCSLSTPKETCIFSTLKPPATSSWYSHFFSIFPLTLKIDSPQLKLTFASDETQWRNFTNEVEATLSQPSTFFNNTNTHSKIPPSLLSWFLMSQLKSLSLHVLIYTLSEYIHLVILNSSLRLQIVPLAQFKSTQNSPGTEDSMIFTFSCQRIVAAGHVLPPTSLQQDSYQVNLQMTVSPLISYFENPTKPFLNTDQPSELRVQFFVSRSNVTLRHPKIQVNLAELRLESLQHFKTLVQRIKFLQQQSFLQSPVSSFSADTKEILKEVFHENVLLPADIFIYCHSIKSTYHLPNSFSSLPFTLTTNSIHVHVTSTSPSASLIVKFHPKWEGSQELHFTAQQTILSCGDENLFCFPELQLQLQFSNDEKYLKPKFNSFLRVPHTRGFTHFPHMNHPLVLFLKSFMQTEPLSSPAKNSSTSSLPMSSKSSKIVLQNLFQAFDFKFTFDVHSFKFSKSVSKLLPLQVMTIEKLKLEYEGNHMNEDSMKAVLIFCIGSLNAQWSSDLEFNLQLFESKTVVNLFQWSPDHKQPNFSDIQVGNITLEILPSMNLKNLIYQYSVLHPRDLKKNPTPSLQSIANLLHCWNIHFLLSSSKLIINDPTHHSGPLFTVIDGFELDSSIDLKKVKFQISMDSFQIYTKKYGQRLNFLLKTSDIKLNFKVSQFVLREAYILVDHEVFVNLDPVHTCLLQRIFLYIKNLREIQRQTPSTTTANHKPILQISIRRLMLNFLLPKNVKLNIFLPLWMEIKANNISLKSENILFSATKLNMASDPLSSPSMQSQFYTLMQWRHMELNICSLVDLNLRTCHITVPSSYPMQDVIENVLLFVKLLKNETPKDSSPPLKSPLKFFIAEFKLVLEDDPLESKLNQLFKIGREAQLTRLQRESELHSQINKLKMDPARFWKALFEHHATEWIHLMNAVKKEKEPIHLFTFILISSQFELHPEKSDFNVCHALDPNTPEDAVFDFFLAFRLSLQFQYFKISLRDYPLPFVEIPRGDHHISGLMVLAEPFPTNVSVMEVRVIAELPCIKKALTPIKLYQALTCTFSTGISVHWGPAIEPCVTFINKIFDQFTYKSLDPSPPLPWWDKLRYLVHGPFHLNAEWIQFHLLGSRNPYYSLVTQDGSHGMVIEVSGEAKLIISQTILFNGKQMNVFTKRPWPTKDGSEFNSDKDVFMHFIGNVALDFNVCCRQTSISHHQVIQTSPQHFVQDSYGGFRSLDPKITLTLNAETMVGFQELTFTSGSIQNFMDLIIFQIEHRTAPIRQGSLFPSSINTPSTVKLSRILSQFQLYVEIKPLCITLWHLDRAILELENGVGLRAIADRCNIQFQCLRVNKQLDWNVDTTDIAFHGVEMRAVYLANENLNTGTSSYDEFERESHIPLRFANQFIFLQVNSYPFLWAPQISYCRKSDLGTPSLFGRDVKQVQKSLLQRCMEETTGSNEIPQDLDDSIEGRTYHIDQEDYLHAFVIHNPKLVLSTQVRDRLYRLVVLHQQTFLIRHYLSYTLIRLLNTLEKNFFGSSEISVANATSSVLLTTTIASTPPPLPIRPSNMNLKNKKSEKQMRQLLIQFIHPQFKLMNEYDGITPEGWCIITTEHMCLTQESILRDDGYEVKTITTADIKDANVLVTARFSSAVQCQLAAPYLCQDVAEWMSLTNVILGKIPAGYIQVSNNVCIKLHYVKHNPLHYQQQEDEGIDDRLAFEFSPFVLHSDPLVYSLLYNIGSNLILYKEPSSNQQKELLDAILFTSEEKDKEKLIQTILSLRFDIRHLMLALQFDLSVFQLDIEEGTAKWADMLTQLFQNIDTLLVLMRAYQRLHRKSPSNGITSQTHIFASHLIWNMLLLEEQVPFAQWRLSTFCLKLMDFEDNARTFDLTVDHFMGLNLLPTPIFKEVTNRYGSGDTDMLRVHWHALAPVAGIAVVTHFEVNICPIKFQLTYEFGKQFMNFLFPLRSAITPSSSNTNLNQDLSVSTPTSFTSSQSIPSISLANKSEPPKKRKTKSRVVSSESNDALLQMKSRASENTTFIYIKIPSVQHCFSYRGMKEKNIEDVHDFVLTSPNLEYKNKTWTWLEFLMQVRRDIFFAILSHTGQLVKEKLFSSKRSMSTLNEQMLLPEENLLTRSETMNSSNSKSSKGSSIILDFISGKKVGKSSDTSSA